MKQFIKLLLLFSIPVLVGLASFEVLLRNIPNDYSFKRKYLDKNSNSIEVLFLGNSHIYYGINPEHVSRKSFNCAHISQSLNYDLAILEKYKGSWGALKCIVIPIDYFSLYLSLENGIEKWRVKNYSIYYQIRSFNYQSNFEIFNAKLPDNFSRLKSYLISNKSNVTCNQYGFGITYNSKRSKSLAKTGKVAAKRHTVNIKQNSNYLKNVDILKSIIKFSSDRNIQLVFVTSPAYKTYTENLKSNQLDTTVNTIRQLSLQSANMSYYNFLNDTSFIARDFFDADHLNEIGAKKLTLKIDSLLSSK